MKATEIRGMNEEQLNGLLTELHAIKGNLQTSLSGTDSADEGERRHG